MIAIIILLSFILGLLVVFGVGAFLAWQKISTFLTWNTRYTGAEYEAAVSRVKTHKPAGPPSITERKGRSIVPADELVDITDLPFDQASKAVEDLANA